MASVGPARPIVGRVMPTIPTGQRCVRSRTLPADLQSAAADATATDPATADPTATNPATANPAATDAATTDAATTDAAATDPTTTDTSAAVHRIIAAVEFEAEQDFLEHAGEHVHANGEVGLVVFPVFHIARELKLRGTKP